MKTLYTFKMIAPLLSVTFFLECNTIIEFEYPSFQGTYGAVGTFDIGQFQTQRQFIEEDYAASKLTFLERIKEPLDPGIIEAPLTRENYKKRFHNMICWEEKRHVEILDTK